MPILCGLPPHLLYQVHYTTVGSWLNGPFSSTGDVPGKHVLPALPLIACGECLTRRRHKQKHERIPMELERQRLHIGHSQQQTHTWIEGNDLAFREDSTRIHVLGIIKNKPLSLILAVFSSLSLLHTKASSTKLVHLQGNCRQLVHIWRQFSLGLYQPFYCSQFLSNSY